jgi:hypothetical protein
MRQPTKALMAKLTFCGMSPVTDSMSISLSFATTTPTTLPFRSSSGPPLFPGCGRRDLQEAAIIGEAGKRRDVADRRIAARREQSAQLEPIGNDVFALAHGETGSEPIGNCHASPCQFEA